MALAQADDRFRSTSKESSRVIGTGVRIQLVADQTRGGRELDSALACQTCFVLVDFEQSVEIAVADANSLRDQMNENI